ncbi:MAG TPA: Gfo/Idh/MocA family oxidoreductase [Bryobacteraceae bacterium]|nr:Gfo/Idh/MocA family oxidoreductase [Bryobacteraceae bacterium]
MRIVLPLLFASLCPAQETIAIIGLRHSHVWGHFGKMLEGQPAKLVGISETIPALIAEAKKRGAADSLFYTDTNKMLDQAKPTMVWAFVENNRHLEIVQACAPRKIHVIFEKPLASTLAEAQNIRRLSLQHGIYIMTNYQMAWWSANYTAKKTAVEQHIGRVWRLRGIVGHGGPGSGSGLNKTFFDWLTDPEKNGGGALMDFGCYNALWSLWYLGKPETVYAHTNQLRPGEFPKVEDNATMILSYKNGVGLFEGSWDLPRSFQELEVFGLKGSVFMRNGKVELRQGRGDAADVPLDALPPERSEPLAYMAHCIRTKRPPDGMLAIDINVDVVEIIEAARRSVKDGKAVKLPL